LPCPVVFASLAASSEILESPAIPKREAVDFTNDRREGDGLRMCHRLLGRHSQGNPTGATRAGTPSAVGIDESGQPQQAFGNRDQRLVIDRLEQTSGRG